MNYQEARNYIEQTSCYGSVLGLDNISELLKRLHHPEEKLRFLHIAGTNGKGSVLAYLQSVLQETGVSVGCYLSPAIFKYRERIQYNGRYIEKEAFAKCLTQIAECVEEMQAEGFLHPTSFEIETALAFLYFKEKKCEIVVLETGLGGLLDATNVIPSPEVCIFTKISRDHMGILGDTLEEIAANKAGIIKPGAEVVSLVQEEAVMQVIRKKCLETGCVLTAADPQEAENICYGYEKQSFFAGSFGQIEIGLAGTFQIGNAVLALKVLEVLKKRGFSLPQKAVREGMRKTKWYGRFSKIWDKPLVFMDGAHNEEAAVRLKESVLSYFQNKKRIFIMGVFADKEYDRIAEIMAPAAAEIVTFTIPENERALSGLDLARTVRKYNKQVTAADSLQEAVEMALLLAGEDGVVLAFGSLSYLGKLWEIFEKKRDLI